MKLKRLFVILITTFILTFSTSCFEVQGGNVLLAETYGNVENVKVISVYDGDTLKCTIQDYPDIVGKKIGVRIYGIDTPEIRGKSKEEKELAIKARDFVKDRFKNAKKIELRNMRRGKYFRILADVYVDGVSIGGLLIKEGLARPYFGGTKEAWSVREK